MAKVFTGKMIIPGNQIETFLEKIEEAEEENKPFRKYLYELNKEFGEYLTNNFSAKTARKHCYKVDLFIDFLCWNTDVKCIAEITRGIANSHFRKWYMSKVGDCSESDLKTAIKKFFQFIDTEKGIKNEAVLKSFKR
jgi:uncharacterized protein (UPF0335 family)